MLLGFGMAGQKCAHGWQPPWELGLQGWKPLLSLVAFFHLPRAPGVQATPPLGFTLLYFFSPRRWGEIPGETPRRAVVTAEPGIAKLKIHCTVLAHI